MWGVFTPIKKTTRFYCKQSSISTWGRFLLATIVQFPSQTCGLLCFMAVRTCAVRLVFARMAKELQAADPSKCPRATKQNARVGEQSEAPRRRWKPGLQQHAGPENQDSQHMPNRPRGSFLYIFQGVHHLCLVQRFSPFYSPQACVGGMSGDRGYLEEGCLGLPEQVWELKFLFFSFIPRKTWSSKNFWESVCVSGYLRSAGCGGCLIGQGWVWLANLGLVGGVVFPAPPPPAEEGRKWW